MVTYSKSEVDELKQLMASMCGKLRLKEKENNALRTANADLHKEIVELKQRCNQDHTKRLRSVQKTNLKMRKLVSRLTENLRTTSDLQQTLENRVKSLEKKLAEAELELEKERRLREAQHDILDEEYQAVAGDLECILDKATSLENADKIIEQTLRRVKQSEAREGQLLQRCCLLQEQLEKFTTDIGSVSEFSNGIN